MATIHKQAVLLAAQRGMKRDLQAMLKAAVERMTTVLLQYADTTGKIPARAERPLTTQLEQIISDVFTAGDNRSAYDDMRPLAEYPRKLNYWIAWATYEVVKTHERWLRQRAPADVFERLHRARRVVQEQYPIFRPNPLAEIDPARRWVHPLRWTDERGYRLSDRIWRADMDTRAKIDELLVRGLREGRSALDIARALEAYLVPTERGVRTLKPYGERFMPDGAAYSAMRLARTEISRAFNQAAWISAYMNPYVTGWDYCLSASHPKYDICDGYATIGMGGDRLKPPYAVNAAPVPPVHPHCLCHGRPAVTDTPEAVTARLRAYVQGDDWHVNPANADLFTAWLLGNLFIQLTQLTVSNLVNVVF